MSEILLLHRN